MAMNYFDFDYLYPVTGADISTWQRRPNEEMDFSLLVSRINFLWIRCLYAGYEDGDFRYYMGKMEEHPNLPYGFYQFLKVKESNTALKNQFEKLKAIINEFGMPPMGIMLDVEQNPDGLNKTEFGNQLAKYLNWCYAEWGEDKVTIYTRTTFWDGVLQGYKTDYPKKAKLFIARYITSIATPVDLNIGLPRDWKDLNNLPYGIRWVMWQFSADGNGLGDNFGCHSSAIDLIRFNGDYQDFRVLFGVYPMKETNILGGDPVDPPPPPEEPELQEFIIHKAKCITGALNVRKGPSIGYAVVEKLYNNEVAEVLEEKIDSYENIWVRIGLNQWSAMKYYNNVYLEYLEK